MAKCLNFKLIFLTMIVTWKLRLCQRATRQCMMLQFHRLVVQQAMLALLATVHRSAHCANSGSEVAKIELLMNLYTYPDEICWI